MNLDFELILFYVVLISGVLALIDLLFFAKKRKAKYEAQGIKNKEDMKVPVIFEYAYSFFPVLLLVFLIRSYAYEPFRIPSGSLEPTLLVGDFVLVNKYIYGLRLPVIHKKIWSLGEPQHGDIFVFHYPVNPSEYFIKRVIGLPGDHIVYANKELTVNGKKMPQVFEKHTIRIDESGETQDVDLKEENYYGVNHMIYIAPDRNLGNDFDLTVPPGMYFAMGDNRDDSADSRDWGYVPEANIVGKAQYVWMSWDASKHWFRWERIGKVIH